VTGVLREFPRGAAGNGGPWGVPQGGCCSLSQWQCRWSPGFGFLHPAGVPPIVPPPAPPCCAQPPRPSVLSQLSLPPAPPWCSLLWAAVWVCVRFSMLVSCVRARVCVSSRAADQRGPGTAPRLCGLCQRCRRSIRYTYRPPQKAANTCSEAPKHEQAARSGGGLSSAWWVLYCLKCERVQSCKKGCSLPSSSRHRCNR